MQTIRQLREELGWSQLDVAVRLRVSVASVSNWERGIRTPRWDHLRSLAQLFGINATDIAAEQTPHDKP